MVQKTDGSVKSSIKTRSIIMLTGLCCAILLIVATSFYYVSSSIRSINDNGVKFDQLSQRVEQVEDIYFSQAKDRKNLFLRGHQEKDLKKYRNKVLKATDKIHAKLQEIYKNPLSEKYQPELKKFESKLKTLMTTYQQGIEILVKSDVPFEADQYVRGRGGKVGGELHSVIETLRKDRQQIHVQGQRDINRFLLTIAILICGSLLVTTMLFLSYFIKSMDRMIRFSNLLIKHEKTLEEHDGNIIDHMKEAHLEVKRKSESELRFNDEISSMVKSFRDLSERNLDLTTELRKSAQMEAEMERLQLTRIKNKELAESLEQKNTLLRVIVHDLSNPLYLVMGYVSRALKMLAEGEIDLERHTKFWKKVEKASQTQKTIIEDCRNLVALDSGKLKTQRNPVSLKNAVQNVLFILENRIQAKNLQIIYDEDHLSKLIVYADESALSNQVIANILSNAIKFSQKDGQIEIIATEKDKMIQLAIRDHGVGMPPKILDRLFDPTAPTSRNGTEGEKGTGFGMPVVKAYMENFQGKIKVHSITSEDSKENHGTTVELSLERAA